jgi:MHS family proline/betaine transporter-like MFS transporter
MSIFRSLNREQKESIGLLQIGTFLEYFDLMLYVHMAVLLNEIFFPKTDAHTEALLFAFAFCSTWVLRPFGALLFGWIGDTIGRKTTVILTTFMMSMSCLIMANLPTYAQIGIAASWIMTICRILQGLSSMGEIIGAQIYITEITKPPVQYSAVGFISIASSLGATVALGVGVLATTFGFNWRIAFWVGATVALVGSIARTKLRETPEFIGAKERMMNAIKWQYSPEVLEQKENSLKKIIKKEKIDFKTIASFFCVYCGWPCTFYLMYMYFIPVLKSSFSYSANDVIVHNFLLSILMVVFEWMWAILSYRINPLIISKGRAFGCLVLVLMLPALILECKTPMMLFGLQFLIMLFQLGYFPGCPIFLKHFPVLKRFTSTSFLYALSRTLVYVATSLGLVYLTEAFGHYGLWVIMLPITVGYILGVYHFQHLENNQSSVEKESDLNTLLKTLSKVAP